MAAAAHQPRGGLLRVPFSSVLPFLPALLALVLIVSLPKLPILRFIVWLAIGLVIYFLYSRRCSGLNELDVEPPRQEEYPAGAAPTV